MDYHTGKTDKLYADSVELIFCHKSNVYLFVSLGFYAEIGNVFGLCLY